MIHKEAWYRELHAKEADIIQFPKNVWDQDHGLQQEVTRDLMRDYSMFPHQVQRLVTTIKMNVSDPEVEARVDQSYAQAMEAWSVWYQNMYQNQDDGVIDESAMELEDLLDTWLRSFQEAAEMSQQGSEGSLEQGPAHQYPMETYERWTGTPREVEQVMSTDTQEVFRRVKNMLFLARENLGPEDSLKLQELGQEFGQMMQRWNHLTRGIHHEEIPQAEVHLLEKEMHRLAEKIYNLYLYSQGR